MFFIDLEMALDYLFTHPNIHHHSQTSDNNQSTSTRDDNYATFDSLNEVD